MYCHKVRGVQSATGKRGLVLSRSTFVGSGNKFKWTKEMFPFKMSVKIPQVWVMTNKNIIKYFKIFILRFWNFNPNYPKLQKTDIGGILKGGHDFVPKETRFFFRKGDFYCCSFSKRLRFSLRCLK